MTRVLVYKVFGETKDSLLLQCLGCEDIKEDPVILSYQEWTAHALVGHGCDDFTIMAETPKPKLVVDRRALMAAQLTGADMINGYADAWFGFTPKPPEEYLNYVYYQRGYERALQQRHTSIDEEFAARNGVTYTVYLQTTATPGGLRWGQRYLNRYGASLAN